MESLFHLTLSMTCCGFENSEKKLSWNDDIEELAEKSLSGW